MDLAWRLYYELSHWHMVYNRRPPSLQGAKAAPCGLGGCESPTTPAARPPPVAFLPAPETQTSRPAANTDPVTAKVSPISAWCRLPNVLDWLQFCTAYIKREPSILLTACVC